MRPGGQSLAAYSQRGSRMKYMNEPVDDRSLVLPEGSEAMAGEEHHFSNYSATCRPAGARPSCTFLLGRAAELELFDAASKAAEPPYAALYIHGPGGIGKTTLLREYARIAATCGRPVISLDGGRIDPTPTGFLLALSQSLGLQHIDFDAVIANWPLHRDAAPLTAMNS